MRKRETLLLLKRCLVFFCLIAAIATITNSLFIRILMKSIGHIFTEEEISKAAILTFYSVIILSSICSFIDFIRYKYTVEKPAKKIQGCLSLLMEGKFDARIEKTRAMSGYGYFGEIADDINKLGKELEGVETLRSDFISNVSHEIKTPLAVIQNYGMLLSSPSLSEEKRIEYSSVIIERSRGLAELVTNILRLNKLENQQIFPSIREFNLSEELCSVLLQFENKWVEKNIELDTDIEEEVIINGDPDLLYFIWNNLFSNAFKFTPEGGKVFVRLKNYGEKVMITVKDSGCGIKKEDLPHIWEKFYQGEKSHSWEGNGLGLALVKRIVDIFHGEIEVQSTEGIGAKFNVTLNVK